MRRYESCPACSGTLRPIARNTFECTRCGGVCGTTYAAYTAFVDREFHPGPDPEAEAWVYYDFTLETMDGPQRTHGYCDRETRKILQVG